MNGKQYAHQEDKTIYYFYKMNKHALYFDKEGHVEIRNYPAGTTRLLVRGVKE